ncbi:hypothetical protein SAMD00079811_68010 [Scytonema sp. HK-05]|nr:hypothetical protein SAMD00079811_68010 [Scytonema sp. HK-05]
MTFSSISSAPRPSPMPWRGAGGDVIPMNATRYYLRPAVLVQFVRRQKAEENNTDSIKVWLFFNCPCDFRPRCTSVIFRLKLYKILIYLQLD